MKTEVKHSESKTAWNIVGTIPGDKYKIARIPYVSDPRYSEEINSRERKKALELAKFISESLLNFKNH